MIPTPEQVRTAAYHLWERRGRPHGQHVDDWLTAEHALRFRAGYRIVAAYPARPGVPVPSLGRPDRRVCRFCEQAAPRTRFSEPASALPRGLGLDRLLAADQCDECRDLFRESLDDALEVFLDDLAHDRRPSGLPIAAYKALVRTALAVLPADALDDYPDAVEWVCNPDHDLDGRSFAREGIYLHDGPGTPPAPWLALARRRDDATPLPSTVLFVGRPGLVVQLAVPLGTGDEDLEGEALPLVPIPDVLELWCGPTACRFLPVASPPRRRLSVLGSLAAGR